MGHTGLSYKHMAVHTVCLSTAVYSSCTHISPVALYKTYIILILHGQVVIAIKKARSRSTWRELLLMEVMMAVPFWRPAYANQVGTEQASAGVACLLDLADRPAHLPSPAMAA